MLPGGGEGALFATGPCIRGDPISQSQAHIPLFDGCGWDNFNLTFISSSLSDPLDTLYTYNCHARSTMRKSIFFANVAVF